MSQLAIGMDELTQAHHGRSRCVRAFRGDQGAARLTGHHMVTTNTMLRVGNISYVLVPLRRGLGEARHPACRRPWHDRPHWQRRTRHVRLQRLVIMLTHIVAPPMAPPQASLRPMSGGGSAAYAAGAAYGTSAAGVAVRRLHRLGPFGDLPIRQDGVARVDDGLADLFEGLELEPFGANPRNDGSGLRKSCSHTGSHREKATLDPLAHFGGASLE
mmetsp:Transcript_20431/g.62257  ORF Transcript_20431/g.62257 Transcript_20431/m.62257 type:complete len:215 (+) Transcript_20431:1336-1980(+)|eukprot:scaffold11005_cov25-Tisochrysis_lutea.AAC.6